MSPAGKPEVTVIVVPRERFSATARSLESLYQDTSLAFSLVYVDGGSPPEIAAYLKSQSQARGFELIRTEHWLTPNEARNIGFARAAGRYVVFLDNDVLLRPGCLEALVRCAEETGADLVGPLYGVGEPDRVFIHMAGGVAHVADDGAGRQLIEEHRFAGRTVSEIESQLKREPTELVEFHCLLARAEKLRSLGPLDEKLMSTCEHIDLCFAIRERGGGIYIEPSARMTYLPPRELERSELPYFRLRWSEAWTRTSYSRMHEKWELSDRDPYFAQHLRWLRSHRRLPLQSVQRGLQSILGRRFARWPLRGLATGEVLLNRWRFRDRTRLPTRA